MTARSNRRALLSAAMAALACGGRALGADRTLRLVVGFAAGGTSDNLARLLVGPLQELLGVTVLVENRIGAGGRIAIDHVRQAAADGSVALLVPDAMMSLYPHVYKNLRYDPERDFVPVARLAGVAIVMFVGPQVPAAVTTVQQYLDWARPDPARRIYGTSAAGATPHFVGDMLVRLAGVAMTPVHYPGGAAAAKDLAGGQIPAFFGVLADGLPYMRAGRIRALAISGPRRNPAAPELPTFAEQRFEGLVVEDGLGVYLPAGAAPAVVARLGDALMRAMATPPMREALQRLALEEGAEHAALFGVRLRTARSRWADVVRRSGFTSLE